MSGFTIEGSRLFSGLFGTHQAGFRPRAGSISSQLNNDDAASYTSFRVGGALHVYKPPAPTPQASAASDASAAPAVETSDSNETAAAAQVSGQYSIRFYDPYISAQIVNNYSNFVRGIHPDQQEGSRSPSDQLIHAITGPLGIEDSDIKELHIESDSSIGDVYASGANQDGSTTIAAAVADEKVNAHLKADIITKGGRHVRIDASVDDAYFAAVASRDRSFNNGQVGSTDFPVLGAASDSAGSDFSSLRAAVAQFRFNSAISVTQDLVPGAIA